MLQVSALTTVMPFHVQVITTQLIANHEVLITRTRVPNPTRKYPPKG